MFSLKLRPGLVWHRGENLASASLPPSISRSPTSRDARKYWNDYAPGLCRYPDVHLMIKKEPGECVSPSSLSPRWSAPPLFWMYFSSLAFSCVAGKDGSLAGDESWGGVWGITDGRWFSCLPGCLWKTGRVGWGKRWTDGEMEPSQSLLGLVFPPVCRGCGSMNSSWCRPYSCH